MRVRQTSLQAYIELRLNDLGDRQLEVLGGFIKFGDATDLEMCRNLGFKDPNRLRPRRNELVKKGYLIEKGRKRCSISERQAIVWGVE